MTPIMEIKLDYPSFAHLVDTRHPILCARITEENVNIFVKYLNKIKQDQDAHWVTAFLMMGYEVDGCSVDEISTLFK
jgi:hypothetical protein